ncbi:thioesterase domain-containing protein [Pigmentibacter sp. JX0631]|uniref:thioesterase II family protein n=1 Tax=Pigmentibacter sp. JX0631 TaxID=2976982 RepID=UPI002468FC4B|nr:thioesterase domain-containing protein [Pigmentibacter sp. JX0631]WGL59181.1 thioesterase domain-containing protein [Pigmentibacter sp. JX0631]
MLLKLKSAISGNKIYLICFHHAGGNAYSIYPMIKYLKNIPELEILSYEFKGRGKRSNENLCDSFSDNLKEVINCLDMELDKVSPRIFLGHSMGGIFAYEYLKQNINEAIQYGLIISSKLPPIFQYLQKIYFPAMEDNDFFNLITEFGGIEPEVLDNKELINYFFPILRNDFNLIYNYEQHISDRSIVKINADILVIYGLNDKFITSNDIKMWQNYSNLNCKILPLSGEHFYFKDNQNISLLEKEIIQFFKIPRIVI